MNKYFKLIVAILIVFSSFGLQAQKSITVAFDPLSIVALGGYEVELGYNFDKNRVAASYLSGGLSPWFSQAEDFERAKEIDPLNPRLVLNYRKIANIRFIKICEIGSEVDD